MALRRARAGLSVSQRVGAWGDTLARECAVALRYASERYGGASPERITLAGQGSQIGGLDELLADRLGCEANIWRPDDVLARCDTDDPALALPVGLAMRFDA